MHKPAYHDDIPLVASLVVSHETVNVLSWFSATSPAKGTQFTLCLTYVRNKVGLAPLACKDEFS